MKVLTFSTLYPNAARPTHGIFVETRLRHLLAAGRLGCKVIAPVPWFPFTNERFGEYAQHARAPRFEVRNGVEVFHPRYPLLPKIGMSMAPFLIAGAVKGAVQRIVQKFPFDLIDAHYLYPDGVAAALLGSWLGKPVVITARGTDVTLIPRYRVPRALIRWAARQAADLITVSQSLKEDLIRLGIPADQVTVLRNGVDLTLFRPMDRGPIRQKLGFSRFTLLSVGHLIPRKAHDLVIRAMALLPELDLVIVGNGPERSALGALADALGVSSRVRFVNALLQEKLAAYYAAADALVLASSREGWANVLLEAMACGTPVVASNVASAPDVITRCEAGIVVPSRTPMDFARAIQQLVANYPDRAATRRHAEEFGWEPTTEGQLKIFDRILSKQRSVSNVPIAGSA
jgi:glycosyltransferase involved in cell wall biosynthesis